jgi:hypothetical protein
MHFVAHISVMNTASSFVHMHQSAGTGSLGMGHIWENGGNNEDNWIRISKYALVHKSRVWKL